MTYTLGAVKPWVASAANEVGPKFGIRTIYGYRAGSIEGTGTLSDHALGLALDFMCGLTTGNALASYVQQNAARLSVTYIIHNRRIWNIGRASEGWRVYNGVNPHTDHVHVSFDTHTGQATPSNGGGYTSAGTGTTQNVLNVPNPINPFGPSIHIPNPLGGAVDAAGAAVGGVKDLYSAMKSLSDAVAFILNPNSWIRILMFLAGLWLLALAIASLVKNQSAANTAQAAVQAGKHVSNATVKAAVRNTTHVAKVVPNAG